MKITIEPETEDEKENKSLEKTVYERVYEFALVGTHLPNDVAHQPIEKSLHIRTENGNRLVNRLIGQLEQMKENLRDIKRDGK